MSFLALISTKVLEKERFCVLFANEGEIYKADRLGSVGYQEQYPMSGSGSHIVGYKWV